MTSTSTEPPPPNATIYYDRPNGDRRFMVITALTVDELDRKIIFRLAEIRSQLNRIVKTVMEINGEEWTYEYTDDGVHVEHIFRNGELTP